MKRLGIISFTLLLVAACARVPLPGEDGAPIRFCAQGSGMQVHTRVSENPHEKDYLIADGNSVAVYGTWSATEEGEGQEVFGRTIVTCSEVEPSHFLWSYENPKYWRKNGIYDFRGVYPTSVHCQYGTSGRRIVTTYSMHTDDVDLMVASRRVPITTGVAMTDSVQLQFRHATTAIRFLFQKGENVETMYRLNSFELQNLHTVGVLMFQGDELTTDSWHPAEFVTQKILAWTAATAEERIEVPERYQDFTAERWHYVIPQTLVSRNNTDAAVRFSVTVNDSPTPIYTTLPLPQTYRDSQNVEHDVVWEPGKKYNYYIQIQPSQASIIVKAVPWDSFYVAVDDLVFD